MAQEKELRELLYQAIRELEYVQLAPDHSLCASSNGADIVTRGMKLLAVADLSGDDLDSTVHV